MMYKPFQLSSHPFAIIFLIFLISNVNITHSAEPVRPPTELPGYYNVKHYLALDLQNPTIRIHIYGTQNVSDWMLNHVSNMAKNIIGSMNYSSHRVQFNDHHIFVITDDDPDVPYSDLRGHKNTGTVGFTILNQTIICAEAVDTLYPELPPTWRAWDTPIHEFGHAIEHTLALESYSDSVFRSADSNYDPNVAREYFAWFNESWFDANLSTNTSGQSLEAKRSSFHQSIFGYYNWLFDLNSNWIPSCDGRPDPVDVIDLTELVGKFERLPVENNWHQVEVSLSQTGELFWRNAAGRSWELVQSNGKLFSELNSPYDSNPVTVLKDANNVVYGLSFLQDDYIRVNESITASDLVGFYDRLPVSNGWHQVSITQDASGTLWWNNASGVQWNIYLNINELYSDSESPYGYQVLTIEQGNNGTVVGLRFNDELYTRQ